jgi:2-methylcitrate dehydratase PrpD
MAAFTNGAMGHMLDYDDIHYMALAHPTVTTAIPGLAIAERLGNVNGEDFITAVAIGNDVMIRIGRAILLSPQGGDQWLMKTG